MIKVLAWETVAGENVPTPRFEDDRAAYPETLVRNILAWLEKEKEVHLHNAAPANQIITPYAGSRFLDPQTAKPTPMSDTPGMRAHEFESMSSAVFSIEDRARLP